MKSRIANLPFDRLAQSNNSHMSNNAAFSADWDPGVHYDTSHIAPPF